MCFPSGNIHFHIPNNLRRKEIIACNDLSNNPECSANSKNKEINTFKMKKNFRTYKSNSLGASPSDFTRTEAAEKHSILHAKHSIINNYRKIDINNQSIFAMQTPIVDSFRILAIRIINRFTNAITVIADIEKTLAFNASIIFLIYNLTKRNYCLP